jgi:hypothetical protein
MTDSRVRLLCAALRFGAIAFIVLRVALHAVLWSLPELEAFGFDLMFSVPGLDANQLHALSGGQRVVAASIALPYLALLAYAIARLLGLLRAFERGEFFTIAAVRHLRAFAGALLLARVLAIPTIYVRSYVVARLLGDGEPRGVWSFLPDDIAVVLVCAVFWLVARMMEEGRRLADENREFV